MDNNNFQNSSIRKFIAPKKIYINNFLYTLKDELKNQKFSYRCTDRKKCKSTVHIY